MEHSEGPVSYQAKVLRIKKSSSGVLRVFIYYKYKTRWKNLDDVRIATVYPESYLYDRVSNLQIGDMVWATSNSEKDDGYHQIIDCKSLPKWKRWLNTYLSFYWF